MIRFTVILLVLLGAPFLAHAQSEKQVDVAAVISKADAEATLGEPVRDPQSRNGNGSDGYYSRCNYYSEPGGKSLVLRVRRDGGKIDAQKEFALLGAGGGKLRPVSGIGDRAAISASSAVGGPSRSLLLYVAKGNALVTVGIGGMDDENLATKKAEVLAKKIVSAL